MDSPLMLKIAFVSGLKEVVLNELAEKGGFEIIESGKDAVLLKYTSDFEKLLEMKSITNVFLITRSEQLNPLFLSRHKSLLGNMIEIVLKDRKKLFKNFSLSCAGSDSKEVLEIKEYIALTYKLSEASEADMKISIGKSGSVWEIAIALTPRPLSVRSYRVANIPGGINPAIAYAMNTFCNLDTAQSYLNIFSGSATLLIEAAQAGFTGTMQGFDMDGKTNAQAIENIRKAGFLKLIQLKTANLLDAPQLGTFDVVVSDLPFGMQIAKGENLDDLYRVFIGYCEQTLNPNGRLVIYTTEYEHLEKAIGPSRFKIVTSVNLMFLTSVNSYLRPKIVVCEFK